MREGFSTPAGAQNGGRNNVLRFMIVESDVFVASDMVEAIAEMEPHSERVVCRSAAEAEQRLTDGETVDVAVIGIPARGGDVQRLQGRLAAMNARWVRVSDTPEHDAPDHQVSIPRPFVTDVLVNALRQVLPRGPQPT